MRRRSGIGLHYSKLPPDEVTVVKGIPVTIVARTIFDLAASEGERRIARVMREADVRRLWGQLSILDMLARHPGRRGASVIRRVLTGTGDVRLTRSELEERFLVFLEEVGLPPPETNVRLQVGGVSFEVDCLWRSARVIVELDGYAVHGTGFAFERDRARDRALTGAGWRVIRVTWRQLRDEPRALAADLRALIGY